VAEEDAGGALEAAFAGAGRASGVRERGVGADILIGGVAARISGDGTRTGGEGTRTGAVTWRAPAASLAEAHGAAETASGAAETAFGPAAAVALQSRARWPAAKACARASPMP
jgi:hypothetical protein